MSAYFRGCGIRNCVLDGRYPGGISSLFIPITAIDKVAGYTHRYRITTLTPHHRTTEDVNNVVVDQIKYLVGDDAFLSQALNGSFSIDIIQDDYTIDYTVPKNPEELYPTPEPAFSVAQPPYSSGYVAWNGLMGVRFHGPGADGGTGGFAERNRVFHLWFGSNHDTYSSKDTIYRNNCYSDVAAGPFHGILGANSPLSGSAISYDGVIARFTSFQPHGLNTGNHVDVNDALVENSLSQYYNRSDVSVTKVDDYTFTYDAQIPEQNPPYPNASAAPLFRKQGQGWQLGVPVARFSASPPVAIFTSAAAHGLSVGDHLEISAVTVDGDANTPYNGEYSDASPNLYKVTEVSGLTFKYEMSANPTLVQPYYTPWFRLHGGTTRKAGTCLIRNGTLASFTTFYPHGLLPGQAVLILGARDLGVSPDPEANPFNGYFEIESVPSSPNINGKPTSFTYRMTGTPTTNAASAPNSSEFWRVRQLAIERNIVEIANIPAGAIPVGGAETPRVYRRLAVRDNVVRPLNDVPNPAAYAVSAVGCQQAIIAGNVVSGLTRTDGRIIWDQTVDQLTSLNNQLTDGRPLRCFDQIKSQPRDELRNRIEDSLLMAL